MSKVPKKKPIPGAKMKPGQKQHLAGAGQAMHRDEMRTARAHWGALTYGRGGRPRRSAPPLRERVPPPIGDPSVDNVRSK